jgi:hypothetical protein
MMMTSEELLVARNTISDPKNWCQGIRQVVRGDHVAHCVLGALGVARGNVWFGDDNTPAIEALDAAIPDAVVKCNGVEVNEENFPDLWLGKLRVGSYNNTHTHPEVLAWFDRAIARTKQVEAGQGAGA